MDPLSELQDDLTLDDPSQALNQLKLASIDEKNWPSDEMPDFPKSGGRGPMSAALGALEGETPLHFLWKEDPGRMRWRQTDQPPSEQVRSDEGGAGAQALPGKGPESSNLRGGR